MSCSEVLKSWYEVFGDIYSKNINVSINAHEKRLALAVDRVYVFFYNNEVEKLNPRDEKNLFNSFVLLPFVSSLGEHILLSTWSRLNKMWRPSRNVQQAWWLHFSTNGERTRIFQVRLAIKNFPYCNSKAWNVSAVSSRRDLLLRTSQATCTAHRAYLRIRLVKGQFRSKDKHKAKAAMEITRFDGAFGGRSWVLLRDGSSRESTKPQAEVKCLEILDNNIYILPIEPISQNSRRQTHQCSLHVCSDEPLPKPQLIMRNNELKQTKPLDLTH